ncbi:MAG TPA: PQQ-binding-like beta-propeller repeat protein [Streptosporangiaceae bacterium]|nr:PQQ-binding-like beta-propeller repeat protein [Streptosporangiaceae bacterium]
MHRGAQVIGRGALFIAASAGLALSAASSASAATAGDWPAYLDGPQHTSFNVGETAISPVTAGKLASRWRFLGIKPTRPGQPDRGFLASPTVVGGNVYIGADTGWFYKLNALTGHVLAKRFIGFQRATTCHPGRGFVDTATVEPDPSGKLTVYVGGADGYLYALRASNLSVKWRSVIAIPSTKVNDFFQWSSPTVARGRVYIGVASNCDDPLVRAALISYSQANGRRRSVFRPMPGQLLGASIWSSAAIDSSGNVYVTTGNAGKGAVAPGHSDSIIKLTPDTLRPISSFKVPSGQLIGDGDFGASPTVFGPYVGACNKNGVFYALHRSTMKLAWSRRIGAPAPRHGISNCSASAISNGTTLFVAGPRHLINGTAYPGSVQALNPNTGALLWQTGLANGVIGSPSMDGGGVLAVGTYDFTNTPNEVYLLDATTGQIVRRLARGSADFAQSVFAEDRLYTANGDGLVSWVVG